MNSNAIKNIEDHIERCYSESVQYTGILSSICRQLAFAEGGLFWFLKDKMHVCDRLIVIGFLVLVLYFIFDAIQYLVGHIIFLRKSKEWEADLKEKKIVDEKHYDIPSELLSPIEKLLYVKLGCCVFRPE